MGGWGRKMAILVCLTKTCQRWFPAGFWQVSNKYPTNPLLMDHTVLLLCYSKTSLAFFWYRHISFDWNYWIDTSVLLTLAQSPWGHKAVKGLKARPLFFSWKVCNFTMGWNNFWNLIPSFLVHIFSIDIFSIFIITIYNQASDALRKGICIEILLQKLVQPIFLMFAMVQSMTMQWSLSPIF